MNIIARMAFLATLLVGCGPQVLDPLLAPGEQAFVGAYQLDDVLLGPGKLVVVRPESMFSDMGESLEQASRSGLLTPSQASTLQRGDCRMQIAADHTFTIVNLPAADLAGMLSIKGNWSITVYHFSETHGYRIAMKSDPVGSVMHAKWFNADKPEPAIVEIYCKGGQNGEVGFRFAKIKNPPPTRSP